MNDLVARLHRALVDAMRQRAARLDQPVTVAEIYQDLIPYRLVRSVGFALNADYEYALLQLLAGEGELARIEPPEVREELRLELLSPNPNVGMFRQYAACDVFVSASDAQQQVGQEAAASALETRRNEGAAARPHVPPDWLLREEQRSAVSSPEAPVPAQPAAQGGQTAQTQARAPEVVREKAAPKSQPTSSPETESPRTVPPTKEPQPAATGAGAGEIRARQCRACGKELPTGRDVRFCPFCGKDQLSKCPNCDAELDPQWRFCIACGTPA